MKYRNIVQSIADNNVEKLEECSNEITNLKAASFEIIKMIDDQDLFQQNNEGIYKNIPLNQLTLLHIAAFYDSLECFIYLHLNKKLDIRGKSASGLLPLHYACWEGAIEVATYILSIDSEQIHLKLEDENDFNLLYCSIFGNKPEILENLLLKGYNCKEDLILTNKIFQKAVEFRNQECLILLYTFLYKNKSHSTNFQLPIEKAIISRNLEAFEILYNNDIDILSIRHIISLFCQFDIGKKFKKIFIKVLTDFDGIDIEPPNDENLQEGICHWACKYNDLKIAELLFNRDNYFINRFDKAYKTGPAYLVDNPGPETVQILKFIIKKGFDVNTKHQKGVYLLELFLLAIDPDYDAIKCLVDNGANTTFEFSRLNNPKTHNKYTPIDYVKDRGNARLKKIFGINQ